MKILEHEGYRWHQTQCRNDGFCEWTAVIEEGDMAYLSCDKDGEFHMKRNIRLRIGENYEMVAKLGVRTFAEAAAFAISLPTIHGVFV